MRQAGTGIGDSDARERSGYMHFFFHVFLLLGIAA
jgi:hypothetical protein